MAKKKKNKQTKPLDKTIAVLVEDGATVGYLIPLLKKTFNKQARVIAINSADIRQNNILAHTDVLFIPGVRKASSAYRNGLGFDGGQKIKDWIAAGGKAAGLCQGAYLLTEKFQYADKYSGVTRFMHSPCGVFEGIAHGPVAKYTNRQNLDNPFIDHHVAKLTFNDAATGAACYAHGPWLELSDNADPAKYDIIARFAEVHGNPIAMAASKYGKGKAIFCSVVPEIAGGEMAKIDDRLLSANTPNAEHIRTGIRFARELAAHEKERQTVWNRLMAEIKPL